MDDKVVVQLAPMELKPIGRKPSLLELIIAALWPYLLFGAGAFAGWVLRGMDG